MRRGSPEHPERDQHPDPSTLQWTGADMQTSTEYVQTASEVKPAVRRAALAKRKGILTAALSSRRSGPTPGISSWSIRRTSVWLNH